jgi:hypothetical protein
VLLGSDSPSSHSQTDIHFIESTEIKTKNSVEWVTLYSSMETLGFRQDFEDFEENESVWSVVLNVFLYLIDYVSQTILGEYLQHTELY